MVTLTFTEIIFWLLTAISLPYTTSLLRLLKVLERKVQDTKFKLDEVIFFQEHIEEDIARMAEKIQKLESEIALNRLEKRQENRQ